MTPVPRHEINMIPRQKTSGNLNKLNQVQGSLCWHKMATCHSNHSSQRLSRHYSISVSAILFSLVFAFAEAYYFVNNEELEMELKTNKIIPDAIDKNPCDIVQVDYYNGIEPNLGHELDLHATYIPPMWIRWRTSVNESLYTLMLIDLDAPSVKHPTQRAYVHWLVVNMKGEHTKTGETLAKYQSVVPIEGSGRHRLVFLAYQQKEKINVTEKFDDKNGPNPKLRMKFKNAKFAEKYKLHPCVAVNFFYSNPVANFTFTTESDEEYRF